MLASKIITRTRLAVARSRDPRAAELIDQLRDQGADYISGLAVGLELRDRMTQQESQELTRLIDAYNAHNK